MWIVKRCRLDLFVLLIIELKDNYYIIMIQLVLLNSYVNKNNNFDFQGLKIFYEFGIIVGSSIINKEK